MAGSKLGVLRRWVRDELRAEGPDGAGFSDFLVDRGINSAIDDLAEHFSVRDRVTFATTTTLTVVDREYNLATAIPNTRIELILGVEYNTGDADNRTTPRYITPDEYRHISDPTDGDVDRYTLWGNTLVLVGEVATGKTVRLWIVRAPNQVQADGDQHELPYYADEALVTYAISICNREARQFERASYYWQIYKSKKAQLLSRGVPQGQRDGKITPKDSYWGPVSQSDGIGRSTRSDTNPGGS